MARAKLITGDREDTTRKARDFVDQAIELSARVAGQHDFGDGFSRIKVAFVVSEAQKTTRGEEARYLASPVDQELEELERASDHLVNVVGRVALPEDHLAEWYGPLKGGRAGNCRISL